MEEKKTLITKKFEFSASHRCWQDKWPKEKNEKVFGLSASSYGHGHNYELHVTVAGDVDPETGMIINLTDLKKIVNKILEQFDHKYLNMDTTYFKNKIPTVENIAHVLFELIDKELKDNSLFYLNTIRLYERKDLYVDIRRSKL
jgi:6-pyruvoyltetrahydropterin/6-carboxytetrahydropterin synthase